MSRREYEESNPNSFKAAILGPDCHSSDEEPKNWDKKLEEPPDINIDFFNNSKIKEESKNTQYLNNPAKSSKKSQNLDNTTKSSQESQNFDNTTKSSQESQNFENLTMLSQTSLKKERQRSLRLKKNPLLGFHDLPSSMKKPKKPKKPRKPKKGKEDD